MFHREPMESTKLDNYLCICSSSAFFHATALIPKSLKRYLKFSKQNWTWCVRQINQLWSCIKLLPYYNLPTQKIPMRKYCLCQNIFTRCVDLKTHTNCSPRLKKWGKKFEIENIFQWFLLVREPQTILHFYFAMFLINKCVSVFKRQNVWKLYINWTWKIVSNLKKLSSPFFQMKISSHVCIKHHPTTCLM